MAAEAVISGVVEQLTGLLFKQAEEQIDLLTGVEGKVENLANSFKRIQAVLADAEHRKHEEKAVQLWLHDLEDVSYEIDDVLDEWNYFILKKQIEGSSRSRTVCSFSVPSSSCFCFKQLIVHREIAAKINEINAKLDIIEKQKDSFRFISSSSTASNSSQEWRPVQTTSFVNESEVFGREAVKNDLISKLLDNKTDPIQTLCLMGSGGIGKTTLAQLAYNDDRVKGHFEKRGWVCVSDTFDVIRVAKQVLETLGSSSPNLNELDPLLQKISKSISAKKFFLVFDDVWTEDETKWASLKTCFKHGTPGSVILLTTRKEMVARAAGATTQIHLGVLSESDSWSLFEQVAFSGQTNHIQHEREKLEDIGRQIAKKCEGLPLALRIIGSFLRYKTNVEEWQKVVESKLWDLKETKMKVFPHLYLSYNELSSSLKSCFSYCAVFPKDKWIEVDELVKLWMAQSYLNTRRSEDEIEDYGRECFESLAARSFFQDFERDEYDHKIIYCKMHDIVHDFAQHLRERECLAIEEGKKQTSFGNPRHVTCLSKEEKAINFVCDGRMGKTRSFFAKYQQLEAIITAHLLNKLKCVRTLKLLQCKFQELPNEIGNLIHLRHFCLGGDKITKLPETIYTLYNLQTLDLEECENLRELPPGIEKLRNLRHLISYELKFPAGIRELTGLQTLPWLFIGSDHNKLGYLKDLNQLKKSIAICNLDHMDDMNAQDANLKSKKYIKKLKFSFKESRVTKVKEAMEALEPPPTLRELSFESYRGSNLPTWITSLTNLITLRLYKCNGLTSLHALGMLQSLQKLEIYSFQQLKSMGAAFLGIRSESLSVAIFPRLMELKFKYCENWEYWEDIISSVEEENNQISPLLMMPRLRRLQIFKCTKLKTLPYRFLRKVSSLECIELDDHKLNPGKVLLVAEAFVETKAAQQSITPDGRNLQGKVEHSTLSTLLDSKDDDESLAAIQWFFSNGVNDKQLVHLFRDPSPSLLEFTVKLISSITPKGYSRRQSLIDHGVLPCFLSLLTNNQNSHIENEVCNIIANIIRWKNDDHVQAIIEAGLVGPLVDLCKVPGDSCIHAANAIAEMILGGSYKQIKLLVTEGFVKLVSRLLDEFDNEYIWIEVMEKILKVGEDIAQENDEELEDYVKPFKQLIQENGGLQSILHLKSHEFRPVRKKIVEILKRYWPEVAKEEENET